MRSLFDAERVAEIQSRLQLLRPDDVPRWGVMVPAQALAHCSKGIEIAMGDLRPPRTRIGRLLGVFAKPLVVGNDNPMKKNSPTAPGQAVTDERDFDFEMLRLLKTIARFVTAGPEGCTTHPHSFLGRLTPDEWSVLMYKHLDHHLRQFGV